MQSAHSKKRFRKMGNNSNGNSNSNAIDPRLYNSRYKQIHFLTAARVVAKANVKIEVCGDLGRAC